MNADKTQMKAWAKEIEENWKSSELGEEEEEEFYDALYADDNWNDPDWRSVLRDNIYDLDREMTVEEAKTVTLFLRKKFPLIV
jgi:hypothetical protein